MSWEDQGRQWHMWFGHGTSGKSQAKAGGDAATAVAYSALAQLPAGMRGAYEGWLNRGGLKHLQAAVPAWTANASMEAGEFQDAFFGPHSNGEAARCAQQVGAELARAAPGKEGDEARKTAGASLAALVRAVRPEGMGHVMLVAAGHAKRHAAAAAARRADHKPGHGQPQPPAAVVPEPTEEEKRKEAEKLRRQNIASMAAVLYAEARDKRLPPESMVVVGSTLLNRMRRNGKKEVSEVWGGYAHLTPDLRRIAPDDRAAWAKAQQTATDLIDGRIPDPTNGATHFYTPQEMRKAGQDTKGQDVSGGLETTPGVTDDNGQPVDNWRPGFANDPTFEPVPTPNFAPRDFKFYRKKGTNRVR